MNGGELGAEVLIHHFGGNSVGRVIKTKINLLSVLINFFLSQIIKTY